MADAGVAETAVTPETPTEAFPSAAEHAAYYNALERATPTTVVPAEPPPLAVEPPAETPATPEPPAAKADEPESDDLPDTRLYFRSPDGTFRKAKGSEIRSKLRETVDQLRQKNRELQALAQTRQTSPAEPPPAPDSTAPVLGARPDLDDYPDLKAWQAADAEWIKQTIAAERQQAEADTQARLAQAAFRERLDDFKADHDDYDEKILAVDDIVAPPLLAALITQDARGPEVIYYLASHPEEFAELSLINANTPVTDYTIGTLRRLLLPRLDAASNGTGTASPAVIHRPAAAPIAPVRTSSPVATDHPPTDADSAQYHADYYNRLEREARQRR